MSLIRIDQQTALNLDAIAFIKFTGDVEGLSATVNFLSVPVSRNQGSNFVSETFEGEAATNLFNLLGETPTQSTNSGEDKPESVLSSIIPSFGDGLGRNKAWYYHRGADGRGYFLAFVNAKGSCSRRTFDAETGRFLRKEYPQGGGAYQDKFASLIQNAKEVTVDSQPNLERDCKVRLPQAVLDHLKKQVS